MLYFPVMIGPITVSYNLSGLSKPLQLSAPVIADIFQGKITNVEQLGDRGGQPRGHPAQTAITIAVRSDSSGTTQNFTLFLKTATPSTWTLGTSSTIKWPSTARAGNGNGGVASVIKSTPGAIGYVDYSDAKASGLTFASIKNKDGNYVAPSRAAASAAAGRVTVAPNLTFHAVWAPGAQLVPDHLLSHGSWSTRPSRTRTTRPCSRRTSATCSEPGQQTAPRLGYAPLPVQPRPDGHGAAQQDRQLDSEFCDCDADQIGSLS